MPSGPNKRKPAKKKKKAKTNKNSTAPGPRRPESDGAQVSSPHLKVNAEKEEDNTIIESAQKASKEKEGKTEINLGSNPQKSQEKDLASRSSSLDNKSQGKKKAVVMEPATTVADYLSQPIEPSPEKETQKVSHDHDQPLIEVASQLNNNTKLQKKNDALLPGSPSEQKVVNENDSQSNQLSKGNEVQKVVSLDEKAYPQSKNSLLPDSTNVKCPYCGKSSDASVNEPQKFPECSQRQPLLASVPQVSEKSSWKSCCGIFELFSGSTR